MCLLLFFWGCSSAKPFEPFDTRANLGRSLSVVYAPTSKAVYLEVYNGGRRYPDFEVNVALKAATSLTASGLGAYAGYSWVVATAPSNAIVVVNPIAMAAAILAAPIIDTTVEATKQAGARHKADPFNKLLTTRGGDATFYPALKAVVNRDFEKTFQKPELYKLDRVGSDFNEDEFLKSLETDRVLVVNAIAAFTPRFEVLEIALLYGLYDRTQGFKKPVYSNGIIVQSKVHAGKLAADTRHEVEDMMQGWLDKHVALAALHYKNSGAPTRNAAIRQVRDTAAAKIKQRETQYSAFDKHDKEGKLWLEDNGMVFLEALDSGYAEAARLLAADLLEQQGTQDTNTVTAPGYRRELYRMQHLDQGERTVYRLKEGALVSIDAHSRFIPFGKE